MAPELPPKYRLPPGVGTFSSTINPERGDLSGPKSTTRRSSTSSVSTFETFNPNLSDEDITDKQREPDLERSPTVSNPQKSTGAFDHNLIRRWIHRRDKQSLEDHVSKALQRVPSAKPTIVAGSVMQAPMSATFHFAEPITAGGSGSGPDPDPEEAPMMHGGAEPTTTATDDDSTAVESNAIQRANTLTKQLVSLPLQLKIQSAGPSQRAAKAGIAFAFDIDGVLVRSKTALPGASESLRLLQESKIPFIFLTNGGGLTEADHVALVGQRLGLQLEEEQFIQSHTPFRAVVPELADKTILVLGGVGDQIRNVARAYGFKHVVTSSDIYGAYPSIYPFADLTSSSHTTNSQPLPLSSPADPLQISAIFIFSSPRDWGLDLQLVLDLLLSHRGILGTISPLNNTPELPNRGYLQDSPPALYFSNPDLTWATSYPLPRVAQGAFAAALRGMWNACTNGASLLDCCTTVGKPTRETYEYGERALLSYYHTSPSFFPPNPTTTAAQDQDQENQQPPIRTVYMIGDNPLSDISGANAFRSPTGTVKWKSILVESGVYQAGSVPDVEPDMIVSGVREAVEWALREEEGRNGEDDVLGWGGEMRDLFGRGEFGGGPGFVFTETTYSHMSAIPFIPASISQQTTRKVYFLFISLHLHLYLHLSLSLSLSFFLAKKQKKLKKRKIP